MAANYPAVSFHFRVDINGLSQDGADIGFQEVSGLSSSVGEYTHKEGGENRFTHRLPDRVTYEKLVLKRGLLKNPDLITWVREAVENFKFKPRDITVTLLNEEHQPLEAWGIIQAYPVKWSVSNFNAQNNEIAVESIELSFQYLRRLNIA